jgi:predicted transposase/invertase (TIGR01784 family)
VQLTEPSFLADRMLYTWSSIYHTQAIKGKKFDKLKPVISIWLLTGSMIKSDDKFHHSFGIWDKDNNIQLSDHCAIHVVELSKWQKPARLQREDYWLYFFREAKNWKELPDSLKSLTVMRQAMNTLQSIADSEEAYLAYLAREDQLMIERTIESQIKESEEQLKESAEQLKESEEQLKKTQQSLQENKDKSKADLAQANAKTQNAEAQIAQLLAQLKQADINPNT